MNLVKQKKRSNDLNPFINCMQKKMSRIKI